MSRLQTALVLALTAAVAVGMAIPAGAAAGPTSSTEQVDDQPPGQTVSAEVGQQLSTVLSLTGAEVRSEAADAGFEQRFNRSNATERGEAVADRAAALSERATELRTEYETLTEAIQSGEIEGVAYAQEVASLAATASTVETSLDRLAERAATLPAPERRALNVTDADLAAVSEELGALSGQTAAAILSQFTGTVSGEIEIGTDNGLEIEVENEDGERSTQLERPRDGDGTYELNQSTALANAKDALSEPATGAWVLTSSSADDGAYEFEFEFNGPGEGEAEVAVDGQTGTVFELEESTEAADDDEDGDDERLAIELIEGEPAPGANVTLLVTDGGQPVSGATVELGEAVVGTTGPDGTVALTLPADGAEIEVTDGEREGELEFEFADDEEDVSLGATADIENGTVTVSVVLGNEPIEGALVTANDAAVGTTGPDGTVSFPLPDDDELDIEIEHGDGEAELEYEFDEEEEEDDEREDEEEEEDDEREDEEEEEDDEREDEEEEEDDEREDEEEEEESENDSEEHDEREEDSDDDDGEENEDDSKEDEAEEDEDDE